MHEFKGIEQRLQDLLLTLGKPRPPVSYAYLKEIHDRKDALGRPSYTALITAIRDHMHIPVALRIGYANSGLRENCAAKVELPVPMPRHGTEEFRNLKITMLFKKEFLARAPLDDIIAGIAHEFAHIVLYSINHPLRHDEHATDLTAMILGYADIMVAVQPYETVTQTEAVVPWWERLWNRLHRRKAYIRQSFMRFTGYLNPEERRFAAAYLDKFR